MSANVNLLEILKYELDRKRYYFGGHYFAHAEQKLYAYKRVISELITFVKKIARFLLIKLQKGSIIPSAIVVDAYFGVSASLSTLNVITTSAPWSNSFSPLTIDELFMCFFVMRLRILFLLASYQQLVSEPMLQLVEAYSEVFERFVSERYISGFILSNEIGFFEQIALNVAKKNRIPSYEFLHGIPAYYDPDNRSRVDGVIVWGDRIKDNMIACGLEGHRVIVSGRPDVVELCEANLRSDLEDVLVFAKALPGTPPGTKAAYIPGDRFRLVEYLNTIQEALMAAGVKTARLRVHPGASVDWYLDFLGESFYKFDRESLAVSLKQATLVIGPTSTGLVDAALSGVAYIVYEPIGVDGNCWVSGEPIGAPFDGSDPRILVCSTVEKLHKVLQNKIESDSKFLRDYIKTPFRGDDIVKLFSSSMQAKKPVLES